MSGGPDLELQAAIVTKLKANAALQALTGNADRVHQVVPKDPPFPYVTIGESQSVPDFAACIDGAELFVTLHVYSRASGYEEAKRIMAALDDALDDIDLTLVDNRCLEIRNDGSRVFKDSDNVTSHGVITFRALVEPT